MHCPSRADVEDWKGSTTWSLCVACKERLTLRDPNSCLDQMAHGPLNRLWDVVHISLLFCRPNQDLSGLKTLVGKCLQVSVFPLGDDFQFSGKMQVKGQVTPLKILQLF